jgi:hypothetical protein
LGWIAVSNIKSLTRQLRNDLAELRQRRAVGHHRPVIIIHGGLPGPILHATAGGKTFRATAWETDPQFIDRVVSDRTPGVAFVGGLPPLPGTDVKMPI